MDNSIFDNMDLNVNPGNDFYKYATNNWVNNNPQPEWYPVWNTFVKLCDINNDRIKDIITNVDETSIISKKINMLYNIIMNWDKRNHDGITPLLYYKDIIYKSLKTNKDIIWDSAKMNMEIFFSTTLGADSKGSGKYEVYIYESGLNLMNKDYYLEDTEDNNRIINAYKIYLSDMFLNFNFDSNEINDIVNSIYNTEKEIAPICYSNEEIQDPEKNYNRYTINELTKLTNFDWKKYLSLLGYDNTEEVIVNNIEYLKYICNKIINLDIKILQHIYFLNYINLSANLLDERTEKIAFTYNKVFTGAKVMASKEKRATNKVSNIFSDQIGELYIKKYFSEESKKDVINIINNLKNSFYNIVKEQSWMSEETKEKALDKLNSINFKIGYPNKQLNFDDIEIDDNYTYLYNMMKIREYMHKKYKERYYNKDIDRDEWYMSSQSVNAYYDPINNEICFPAGILQYPYYDINRNIEENYGGIGCIIAHEMTHSLDNHGRLYDKNGILGDWWKEEDSIKFNNLTKNTINRFNNLEALPGLHCNGTLTLGENIADFGGIKISYNALFNILSKQNISNDDIKKRMKTFFIAYANDFAGVTTEESIKTMVSNNEHTIDSLRINGTLPMFNNWYEIFNINENVSLYLDKEKRAKIW